MAAQKNNESNQTDTQPEKIDKEFKLTTLALNNKNTIFILLVIIVFMGVNSYITPA